MNDQVTSVIRTAVPLAVGSFSTWLLSLGITLPKTAVEGLTSLLVFLLGSAYYVIARKLEQKDARWGYLLGKPSQPIYK